jgi:hypothetical protein
MTASEVDRGALRVPEPLRATRIDWTEVARLLADGRTTAEIARAVGCSRQHVWRLLRRSASLHRDMREAGHEATMETGSRFAALQPRVVEELARQLDNGNVRVLLWLASRINLNALSYVSAFEARDGDSDPLGPETRAGRDGHEDGDEDGETDGAEDWRESAEFREAVTAVRAANEANDTPGMIDGLLRIGAMLP